MNVQIFGTKKNADTRKAERWFKERGIRFQFVDLREKGLSRGELQSVAQAAGGADALADPACRDGALYTLFTYLTPEARFDKLLENPVLLRQPIVRNGRAATVGYEPDVWKTWA